MDDYLSGFARVDNRSRYIDEVVPNVTDAREALLEGYEELNLPLPEVLQPMNRNAPFLTDTIIQLKVAWSIGK